jgi:anti-anti-sigma factor
VSERVLTLSGEYDAANRDELRAQLAAASRSATTLSVDMTHVSFIDSTAIRELLHAKSRLRARAGDLVLTNLPERAARILKVMGLLDAFETRGPPPSVA